MLLKNIVYVLLQERFIIEDTSYHVLDADTCKLIVELISALMSSPPQIEHITAIVKFLILSHPANATYVSQMRSSFYFLLPTISASNYNSNNLTQFQNNHSLSSNDDIINTARMNILSNNSYNNRKRNHLKNYCSAGSATINVDSGMNLNFTVDPVKLNKALTNLKLRQNSKIDVCEDDENEKENIPKDVEYNRRNGKITNSSEDEKCSIATVNRQVIKSNSRSSIGNVSNGTTDSSLNGNGCDSGIAGSFKDNIDAPLQKQVRICIARTFNITYFYCIFTLYLSVYNVKPLI